MDKSPRQRAHDIYHDSIEAVRPQGTEAVLRLMAQIGLEDLFFFLVYILRRQDADHDFIYDRCREVEESPDGHLDLWSRGHYKSSIITNALTIQTLARDPETTVGIFSITRPIAKQFLRQIKRELEDNQLIKDLYPEAFWPDPKREAPSWGEDNGLIIKRRGNPKEATVEAWGLVDGQPTSKHFRLVIYDDVVSRESVTSREQIAKTTEAWALSLNLGCAGCRRRYIGTRWHYNDTYKEIIDRGAAKPRVYTATADGTLEGRPVLLSREELAEKYREMGPHVAAAQLFMNPKQEGAQGFKSEWPRFWAGRTATNLNIYILVDGASEKKKDSDYTVFAVVGLGADRNYYILQWVRDRLNLTERGNVLFRLHQTYQPRGVGYEKYGAMADIDYMTERMDRQNYRFSITPLGGTMAKPDRIKRLVPAFQEGRVWLPDHCWHTDYQGEPQDLTAVFLEELREFPFSAHDDMMDATSRIMDPAMGATFPQPEDPAMHGQQAQRQAGDWDLLEV